MKSRLRSRQRFSTPQLEYLPRERLGRTKRILSLGISPSKNDNYINSLDNEQLIQEIDSFKEENQKLHSENLIFAHYLRRVSSSGLIETFEQYASENDIIDKEIRIDSKINAISSKLPKVARRLSMRRGSTDATKSMRLWNKLLSNWRENVDAPRLLRVEQEKLSIAAYEIEQTQLDWQRMRANALLTLDKLDVTLRTTESDIIAEQSLQLDLGKYINQFKYNTNERKSNGARFIVPVETLIGRITKRMEQHKRLIDYLNMDIHRTQARIRAVDALLRNFDDLHEKTDEVDINFVRTKKIDYLDTFKRLEKQYTMDRSSQYPLLRELQEWKKRLSEQEKLKIHDDYKCELLENYLETMSNEFDSFQNEIELILNENYSLKNRIAEVKKVPTITEYAHSIQRTKRLQDDIDIWTQRVSMAEVSF
ncbi:unnamed protein product [Rotaria magnacalcarata]|uniref:Uncharacterized protein n=3 Tax=Rotaria magnacalcarata TaxID=392030 RepID=A0A819IR88_9BILA|nr:unnamed protein product [Rotaria magnacalcarata]CAF3917989.1 unnamed protein product [Rotaria magnacalcarata]